MAVLMCITLASVDVEPAFVKAKLIEEMNIRATPGTDSLPERHVFRLMMSLYELKQSQIEWNDMLRLFLGIDNGVTQLRSKECLYVKQANGVFLNVAIYVDDIVIVYNCAIML